MQETSLIAYREIKEKGLLSKRRQEILDVLAEFGSLTAGEIFDVLQQRNKGHTLVKGSVCARLTELSDMGVITQDGYKLWNKTQHQNILWKLSGEHPKPLDKKKSKDKIISELQERIEALEKQLERYAIENSQLILRL